MDDHWEQPGDLFRKMTPEQKQLLFDNTARAINGASEEVLERHIGNCSKADPTYGEGVARAIAALQQQSYRSPSEANGSIASRNEVVVPRTVRRRITGTGSDWLARSSAITPDRSPCGTGTRYGDDFCGRPYFRRALQSGRYAGGLVAREVRGHIVPYTFFRSWGVCWQPWSSSSAKAVAPTFNWRLYPRFCEFLHVCARLRRTEHRYGQGHVGQFFLRAGDRIHCAGGGVFRRQISAISTSGIAVAGISVMAVVLVEYLDFPAG